MKFYIHKKIEEIILKETELPKLIDDLVSGIELVLTEPFFFADLSSDSDGLKKILKFCNSKETSIHLPFYDLNLGSVDRNISDYSLKSMMRGLDIAELVGAKVAVAHLGYNTLFSKSSAKKWFKKFITKKEELEEYAQKKGVTIVWENTYEKDFFLFDEIVRLHPETKFCLDIGHCNCFADFTADEFLEKYKDSVIHLHIHDNLGTEDSHLAPGKGNIDFAEIMASVGRSSVKTGVFEIDFKKFIESADIIRKIFF